MGFGVGFFFFLLFGAHYKLTFHSFTTSINIKKINMAAGGWICNAHAVSINTQEY